MAQICVSRRSLLGCSGSILLGSAMNRSKPSFAEGGEKPKDMVEWMDSWTGSKARDPVGGLYVFRFKDPMWAVLKPISRIPNPDQLDAQRVDVPVGFVTDFASIPRAFYSLLPPNGEYSYAAVFHDYLYWTQQRSRVQSDEILRLAMMDFGISTSVITTIYEGVRLFGSTAWDENARLKSLGEKRILVRYPDNPLTTWAEWKKDPTVFSP
jgi:hypothetical protein